MTAATVVSPGRSIRLGGREYPLVLPTVRDPRLHLAAVIFSLQALGQTVLDFDLSIAQILVSLATCFVLETVVTFGRDGVVAWPASALLTGNGVAFILRVPGTEHGDWWSLRGAHIFAAVAALSLVSKYLVRWQGRHVFNPSNIGLVLCFLVLGSDRSDPQDLWWGPWSPGLAVTLAIIVVGGLLIVSRLRLLGTAVAFWVTFAAGVGLVAAGGHCITARWHIGPICGADYWRLLVFSPEILVFLFFMITDPRTTPLGRRGRVVFGAAVGVLSAVLVAPMTTEFATKVAVLAALAVVCAVRPFVERAGLGAVHASRLRLAAGGVVALPLAAGLVIVGGEALPSAAVVSLDGVERPDVEIDADALPPILIHPDVDDFDASFGGTDARRLAVDLAEDVVIEAEALLLGSRTLARSALVPPRLDQVESALLSLQRGETATVRRWTFEEMAIVVFKPGEGPQTTPRLAVLATAVVSEDRLGGSPASTVPGGSRRVTRRFVVEEVDGHFLLADIREAGS